MRHVKAESRKRLGDLFIIICFLAVLAAGLLTYRDYGLTVDEVTDRRSSIVNYQYVYNALTGHDLRVIDVELSELRDRYYGVFVQFPPVIAEHLTGFSLTEAQIYDLRHLYIFLFCFFSYLCFFGFCRRVFKSKWLGLLGALMLCLYPRFWGEQFTNIKDMVFMASVCIALLATWLCLEREDRFRYGLLAAFCQAVCVNVRVVGAMLPLMTLGYRLVRDLWLEPVAPAKGRRALWLGIGRYLLQALLCYGFYVMMTPALWAQPVTGVLEVLRTFSNFDRWGGRELFFGQLYEKVPWYYIPAWLGLSLPLWYLAALAAAVALAARSLRLRPRGAVRRLLSGQTKYLVLCCFLALLPWLAAVVCHSTLYNGWRHFYFIMPLLVAGMLCALKRGFGWAKARGAWAVKGLVGFCCLMLALQTGYILTRHPYEKVYMNPVGVRLEDGFSRDYWWEATRAQAQYIMANDPSPEIRVLYDGGFLFYLTPEQRARVVVLEEGGGERPDYIIDPYKSWPSAKAAAYDGYTRWHTITVDGHPISTVFIRNDVLPRVSRAAEGEVAP